MKENGRIIQRLQRLYNNKIDRDVFSRRKATARELEAVVRQDFTKLLDLHLPTSKDIAQKGDNK